VRPYSPEAVEEIFGPPGGGFTPPEGASPNELARALRGWQEENPWDDLSLSFTGGTPYATMDFAASRELEEPWWLQALYAAGIIPAVGPAVKVVGKNTKKLAEILAELPPGGIRKWFEDVANKDFMKGDDEMSGVLTDMFSDEGGLKTLHGSGRHIEDLTTPRLEEILGQGEGMQIYGPGLYSSTDPEITQAYGRFYGLDGDEINNIYGLTTPPDEIPGYIYSKGLYRPTEFSDQTDQVKDAIRSLYPKATDEEAAHLLSRSPILTDNWFSHLSTNPEYAPFIEGLQKGEVRPPLAGNRKAREVGIKGSLTPTDNARPANAYVVHGDPDSVELTNMFTANSGELSRAIRENTIDVSKDYTPQSVIDTRRILEELFGKASGAETYGPGLEHMIVRPDARKGLDEMIEYTRQVNKK